MNVASGWVLQAVSVVTNLVAIGYVIRRVGMAHYGAWAGVAAIIGYLQLLDAGMSVALQHYVARFKAEKDQGRLRAMFSSAYVVYGLGGILAFSASWVISVYFHGIFPKISPEAAAQCMASMRWVACGTLIFFLNLPVQGSLLGLQRHYVRNGIEVLGCLVRFGVIIGMFHFVGASLAYLGFAYFLTCLVRFVLSSVFLRIVEPVLRFRVSSLSIANFKELLTYGAHSTIWTVCNVISRDSGPIIANLTLGPKSAAYLYLGTQIVKATGSLILTFGTVFIPMASSLHAMAGASGLGRALIKGTRVCSLFGLSLTAMLIVFGRDVLFVWVGSYQPLSYWVLVTCTLGLLGPWVFTVAQAMLMGTKVLGPITKMMVMRVVLSIALGVALAYLAGVIGLAVGIRLPLLLTTLMWIPREACRKAGISLRELSKKSIFIPTLIAIGIGLIGWSLRSAWPIRSFWMLAVESCIMLVVFGIVGFSLGMDRDTRGLVLKKLRIRSV